MDERSIQLEQTILSFLSGRSIETGNAFFLRFVESDEAWSMSIQLCGSSSVDVVKYFAANMLYTKVRKNWSQLSEENRTSLHNFLIGVIGSLRSCILLGDGKAFMNRIILTLGCVSAHVPHGILQYVSMASDLAVQERSSGSSSTLGLDMLILLPGEVTSLDVSRNLRVELEQGLLQATTSILSLADSFSASGDGTVTALKCVQMVHSWIACGGLTLPKLFEEHGSFLRSVCSGLQSTDGPVVREICSFLSDIVSTSEYPRSSTRNEAITLIANMITSSSASLALFFKGGEGVGGQEEEVALEICNCVSSIVEEETEFLVAGESCNVELISLLLSCIKLRPRKLASITFDAWLAIQDVSVSSRHAFVQGEVFASLMDGLLAQCAYPATFTNWETDAVDDEDDFESFRDNKQGIQEVALLCYNSLQGRYFELLSQKLNQAVNEPIASWHITEVALYFLQLSMEGINETVKRKGPDSAVAQDFLSKVTSFVLTIARDPRISNGAAALHPLLGDAMCRFLGSITFLLVDGSTGTDLFVSSLEFLFDAFRAHQGTVRASAGKSIHQLCIRGSNILLNPTVVTGNHKPLLVSLVEICASLIDDDSLSDNDEPVLLVVEAIVRAVAGTQPEAAAALVSVLGAPVIAGIGHELSLSFLDVRVRRIEVLMKTAGQIVRFCDAPSTATTESSETKHILAAYLASFWPILTILEQHAVAGSAASIRHVIFDFYSRCLSSAAILVLPHVYRIAESIVTETRRSLASLAMNDGSACCSSALHCASSLVDTFGTGKYQNSDADSLILHLFEQTVNAFRDCFNSLAALKASQPAAKTIVVDPESTEKLFSFVYNIVLFCPVVLHRSAFLPEVADLAMLTATLCRERGPVRALLQVVQALFLPPNLRASEYQEHLLRAGSHRGKDFIDYVLRSLDGGLTSSLWPNLSECLYAIISGCEESLTGQAKYWISNAMSDPNLMARIPLDRRNSIVDSLLLLANSNKRRFKALIQDLAKVCNGELMIDALLAFEDT